MTLAFPKPGPKKRRPHPGRLQGKELALLRHEVFERDKYRCRHMMKFHDGSDMAICGMPITWETGHLAHIKSRGAGGTDTADNLVTKCRICHMEREHMKGER